MGEWGHWTLALPDDVATDGLWEMGAITFSCVNLPGPSELLECRGHADGSGQTQRDIKQKDIKDIHVVKRLGGKDGGRGSTGLCCIGL